MSRIVAGILLSISPLGCSGSESAERPKATGGTSSGGGGGSTATGGTSTNGGGTSSGGAGGTAGSGGQITCTNVTDAADVEVASAGTAEEYLLKFDATTTSHTSWAEPGNEALIVEVKVGGAFRSHVVLHHGADGGTYRVALGALAANDPVTLRVSPLSAANATRSVCIANVSLSAASSLPEGEGIVHAPILKWPKQKRFDDLPVVLGWSKQKKSYQVLYTNENGGTTEQCGGGADGVRAEIARWGRAFDIEGPYRYGATETWGRCTGSTDTTAHPIRKEAEHPILYYADGHNRLFEHRGGYGQTCGSGGAEKSDGDLEGFNVQNPGNDASLDDPFVVTIRLAPDSLDDLGFGSLGGRREALADKYAPWAYRLLGSELEREGKIDGQKSFVMEQYIYADVYAADVGGSGDSFCALLGVGSGFVLRAKTSSETFDSGQMTADYFGGDNAVKRMAIPVGKTLAASAFQSLVFDAYDDDGIYWLAIGDVFIPRPTGDNGATIDSLHSGKTNINVYVDDDQSGCTSGNNADGPAGIAACVGSDHTFGL